MIDGFHWNIEQEEQKCDDNAGAIFALGAVDKRRVGRRGREEVEERGELRTAVVQCVVTESDKAAGKHNVGGYDAYGFCTVAKEHEGEKLAGDR